MKNYKILVSVLLSLLTTLPYQAVGQVSLSKSSTSHEGRTVDSWKASVDTPPKSVKSAWKDYMNDSYDAKVQGFGFLANKDVLTVEEHNFPEVSKDPVTLYLKVTNQGSFTDIWLFAGSLVSEESVQYFQHEKYGKEATSLKALLEDFVYYHLLRYRKDQFTQWEETYQDLTEEREDLLQTMEDNREDIIDMEKQIVDLKNENKKLERDLEENQIKLTEAKTQLELEKENLNRLRKRN